MVHVLNAPSPAATASLSVGETIAKTSLAPVLIMLKIYCPPGFTAEKEWIFHFLLKQSLGLEYETIQEAGQSDYTIHMPSGKKVVIEDHFWKNAPSDWPKDTGENT